MNTPFLTFTKPPVTDAVIALHFVDRLPQKAFDAFALKHKKSYPRSENIVQMKASFNTLTASSATDQKIVGRKLSSEDGTSVVQILESQLAVSRLPPYTDWEALVEDVKKKWLLLEKSAGKVNIRTVSTRYVNRIDLPVSEDGEVDMQKYFNIGLATPPITKAMKMLNFVINGTFSDQAGYIYVVQFYPTLPALIDCQSFILDIDVSTTQPVPANRESMWDLVNSLRDPKNQLFDSCVTEETKRLFI